jgi:hypothetical protein
MLKPSLIDEQLSNLISNQDISDESIYIVYQFLSNLVLGFESVALGRIIRYSKEQEKMREEMISSQSNNSKI